MTERFKPTRQSWLTGGILLVLVLGGGAWAAPGTDYKIDRNLMNALADDEEAIVPFFVVFGERPNLAPARAMRDRAARGRFVVQALQATADRSQAGVRGYLRGRGVDFTPFWVENKIYVRQGTLELARALARRPEVVALLPEIIYTIPPPQVSAGGGTTAIEWNISRIGANLVWTTYGTKGAGLVVANIDTGVQYDHSALYNQYRGKGAPSHTGHWKDPTLICGTTPCDNNGHGTHTMGTMVGYDGGVNQIGVAPEAKWIACKGCATNSCSDLALTTCAQWIMDPYEDGSFLGQPDVVNNSWGGGGNDDWYRTFVQSWRAAGIFPAFSIGNGGPNCNTAGSPGDYPESFGSGATDIGDVIASFSARGPSAFGGIIKPNLSAPGVNVRSSYPTNTYTYGSGTSMASPHAAGAVALFWAARPAYYAQIGSTEQLLQDTAVKYGTTQTCGALPPGVSPNNTYGYGRLDVKKAVDLGGPLPNQPPEVHITSPANGASFDCGTTVTFTATVTDPEGEILTPSWTDNGAPLGTGTTVSKTYACSEAGPHTIVASATDSKGASDTDTISITIINTQTPAAPSNLTATASGLTVTLKWTDNSNNETGFRLEYKYRLGKTWTPWATVTSDIAANATSYFYTVANKGQYQYRLFALNPPYESAPSNTASVRVK